VILYVLDLVVIDGVTYVSARRSIFMRFVISNREFDFLTDGLYRLGATAPIHGGRVHAPRGASREDVLMSSLDANSPAFVARRSNRGVRARKYKASHIESLDEKVSRVAYECGARVREVRRCDVARPDAFDAFEVDGVWHSPVRSPLGTALLDREQPIFFHFENGSFHTQRRANEPNFGPIASYPITQIRDGLARLEMMRLAECHLTSQRTSRHLGPLRHDATVTGRPADKYAYTRCVCFMCGAAGSEVCYRDSESCFVMSSDFLFRGSNGGVGLPALARNQTHYERAVREAAARYEAATSLSRRMSPAFAYLAQVVARWWRRGAPPSWRQLQRAYALASPQAKAACVIATLIYMCVCWCALERRQAQDFDLTRSVPQLGGRRQTACRLAAPELEL
jgi:hypothetical protein